VATGGATAPTFLFTDVEGSTRLWEAAPTSMRDDLADHDRLLTSAVGDHGGHVFKFRGDGIAAVFDHPADGVAAAVAAQRSIGAEQWRVGPLRVRMGLHSGDAQHRDGDWFGPTVNRAARLHDVAHGGQIVVSGRTATLVTDRLPAGITLLDLGEHRLRDLSEPEHIHQVVAPDLHDRFSPLRTEHHPSRGVPAPAGRLLGRSAEQERLDQLLRDHRTVTITGPPGGGKSRLAVELARDHRDHWPGGVWFCSLASLAPGASGAAGVAGRLADLLGSAVTDGGTPLDAVVGALSERRALVVLDGCDHVLADAATVASALRDRCHETAVLVTSRERLGIADEHLLDLPTLTDEDAITLFEERALAVRQDFDVRQHQGSVRSLIEHLDGLPLAIELAAARVRTHAPAEIDQLLREHVRVLRAPRKRGASESGDHQDLEAAISWSYDLLEADEQRAFRHLAVFAGSCTAVDLAARVDGEDAESCTDLLDGLVERSLLALAPPQDEDRTSRYRLLSTLRAFARRRLEEHPEGSSAWARHARLVSNATVAAAGRLCGPDEVRWVRELADRWEDVRAVMRRALDGGDLAVAMPIVASLTHHSTMRGVEVGDWADALLEVEGFWSRPEATIVGGLAGEIHIRRADFDGARRIGKAVLAHAGEDDPATWLTHSSLGMAAYASGDFDKGRAAQERMRAMAQAYTDVDPLAPAVAGYMTATVLSYAGRTSRALRYASDVADWARETLCPTIASMANVAEGRALLHENPVAARAALQRALELATSVDNRVLAAQTRWALAEVATADDPEGALRSLQDLLHTMQSERDNAQGQQTLLHSLAPLLSLGADEPALLAAAALDPSWGHTVLHQVARQRLAARTDEATWKGATARADQLGVAGVIAEVTLAIDGLLGA
jgi:predicted ATPase/class 3 adenylate cyclase